MKRLFNWLKWRIEKLVLHNPYLYFYIKKALERLPFFLPHDRDFYALKHLNFNDKNLFLDIGANDGISARSFRRLYSDFEIFSIEANPYHKASLERLKKNDSKFSYQIMGAGSEPCELELYTPVYRGKIPLHSAASVNVENLKNNFGKFYSNKVTRFTNFEKSKIRVQPVDELNLKPGIIKIDTEGFDHEVLKGLKKTIQDNEPSIMVESHQDTKSKIYSFFDEIDYVPVYYNSKEDAFSKDIPENAKNIFGVSKKTFSLLPHEMN